MPWHQYGALVLVVLVATVAPEACARRVNIESESSVSVREQVDTAIQLWCDSSVEVMKLSRTLRKADDKDIKGTFAVLQRIGVLIQDLNKCQITDIKLTNGRALPALTDLSKTMLSGIIQKFREQDIQSYLDSVAELRRLFGAKGVPIKEPSRHWIKRGDHRTGFEIMSSNLREGVASKSWLTEWEQKLNVNVAEIMIFGFDDRMRSSSGQATNDELMQSVFGNYMQNKSGIMQEQRREEEVRQRQCGIDMGCLSKHVKATIKRSILDPVNNFVKDVFGRGKNVPHVDEEPHSSMMMLNYLEETDEANQEVVDADDSAVGHALAPRRHKRHRSPEQIEAHDEAHRQHMNQIYGHRVTNLNEWCAAVIDVHGLSPMGFAAILIWLVGVLIPALITGAVLIALGVALASLLLGIAVVTAPIWISVLGVLKVQGRI